MGKDVTMVCSNKPRAAVQNNHSKGHAWWVREVHHIKDGTKTLCGRNAEGWITFGAEVDAPGLCERCAKKFNESPTK